jgi:hypothetical protein
MWQAPFGGIGESGLGCYKGKFSLDAFAYKRGIMRRDDHAIVDVPIRYSPYTKFGLDVFLLAAKLPDVPPISLPSLKTTLTLGAFVAFIVAYIVYQKP